MALPKAFIAIEKTMSATMRVEWDRTAREFLKTLHPLIVDEKWHEAHDAVNKLSMRGVVSKVKAKIEELAVTAVLFGAHHVTGSVEETMLFKTKAIPQSLHHGVSQLVVAVEQNGGDYLRKQLHAVITALQRKDEKAHVQKDADDAAGAPEDVEGAGDLDETQLARTGGLMLPSQAGLGRRHKKRKMRKGTKTLYVNRALLNADEVIAWAHTQGFKNVQQASDMHVTICYSKEPFDWDNIEPDEDTVKIVAGTRELHAFGKAGDAIVLTFESPELIQEHQAFASAGASYDFPTYKSHITVTWLGAPRPLAELEPYRGPLIFGPQEFAPINDDWKEPHVETVLRKAAGVSLADQLNEAVLRGGQVAIDAGANLTTSRLVSFGFLSEAHAAGAESYQVNEVLDGITCPVCRYMHGKTFRVDSEYSKTLQALSTGDPNDLASISPWPDQSLSGLDDLFGMSLGEMQGEGYGSPPYHPFCRGILALVGSVEENVPLGGQQVAEEQLSTDGVEGEVAEPVWDEIRITALQDAIEALADDDLKLSAVASVEAGEYDAALEAAQQAIDEAPAVETSRVKGWSAEDIGILKWSRFDVVDPEVFKLVDDAFNKDDFDGAQTLLTAWKDGDEEAVKVAEKALKDDPDNDPSPNSGKKKRKNQTASGREQDYSDIKPDDTTAVFDTLTANAVGAPFDKN
jgi:tetratricopeptide (TPR) repeat protein